MRVVGSRPLERGPELATLAAAVRDATAGTSGPLASAGVQLEEVGQEGPEQPRREGVRVTRERRAHQVPDRLPLDRAHGAESVANAYICRTVVGW
jgi:hypothetical protein